MGFDKKKFRENAKARAQKARRAHLKEKEAEKKEDDLSLEEKKVVEQYRKWRATRESSKPMSEKEQRIARIKAKIAEKRMKEDDATPDTVDPEEGASAVQPGAKETSDNMTEARRERVARIKRKLESNARRRFKEYDDIEDWANMTSTAQSEGDKVGWGYDDYSAFVDDAYGGEGRISPDEFKNQLRNYRNQFGERKERVTRLRRKLEKKARIEKIRARIAEKRDAEGDTTSATQIREQAASLKSKVARLRRKLKENEMMAPAAPAGGVADPAAAPVEGADPMAAEAVDPTIQAAVTEIENQLSALKATLGIPEAEGAELGMEAGVEPVMDTGAAMEQPVMESVEDRKAAIRERIAAKRNAGKVDNMVEATKDRVAKRREALKALRAKAMNEDYKSEGAEANQTDEVIKNELEFSNAINDRDAVLDTAGRNIGSDSPEGVKIPTEQQMLKGTGSGEIAPAQTWAPQSLKKGGKGEGQNPPKPSSKKLPKGGSPKIKESEDFDPEDLDKEEESTLMDKHVDHYIERKSLDFRDLVKKGMLG